MDLKSDVIESQANAKGSLVIQNIKFNIYTTFFYGILTALFFSAFIYLEHYGIEIKLLNTILGLLAFILLLYIPKRSVLIAGFFIGLLWFYWIGYSFKYQNVAYMTPIVTVGFGFIYLIFFSPLYFTSSPIIRAGLLFALSFIDPFNWNWMQLPLPFINSYIGVYKWQFGIVLLSLALPSILKKYKFLPLLGILLTTYPIYPKQQLAPLKIKLVQTSIRQNEKWQPEFLKPTLKMIFQQIDEATKEKYDVVLFPESVFPIYLNKEKKLIKELQKRSKNIVVVAGALLLENHKHYNVTYKFENEKFQIAKKVVLVPFGEYIPLPDFARDFINETFFSGASDFIKADKPTDFLIKGVKFRNAICYEATTKDLYKGDVKYILASSNNAWFSPSIEPTLQKLLMQYYGRKNGVVIYHSTNDAGTGVVY